MIIESAARDAGLDFFEVVFEMLDAKDVNAVAAYGGFPVRYPSWRFGMEYERLQKGYTYGLSKIYELVINNDPTYAYLVRSNSLMEQKLVMAHVFGHADFFKHNVWFSPTESADGRRDGARTPTRVRELRRPPRPGDAVERFLDLCAVAGHPGRPVSAVARALEGARVARALERRGYRRAAHGDPSRRAEAVSDRRRA